MGKHLARIQAGLKHFKELMSHSKPPLRVQRTPTMTTMHNPLGNHQFSHSPRVASHANAQANRYSGFYNNPGPSNPAHNNPGHMNPGNNNSNHGNPGNGGTQFYGSMPPLLNPIIPPGANQASIIYETMAVAQAVNQAPPPNMLPSLSDLNNNNAVVAAQPASPMDQQVNSSLESEITDWSNYVLLDELGPLHIEEDLRLYEDFLRIEQIRTCNPESTNQLKNLANGDYFMEANTQWHKSAHLMALLIKYYRKHFFEKNAPFTFSEIITRLTPSDLGSIWNCQTDLESSEFLRRFLQGVRYLTPEKREKYNVIVKGGLMYWAKWGMDPALDTTIAAFFKRKHSNTAHLGKDSIAIWVLSKEDKLYTHPAKIHRFHHSSFTSGDVIRCAGDWEVQGGKLIWVSAMSGHYCPTFDHFKQAVQKLSNSFGINLNTFKVKIFKKEFMKPKEQIMMKASEFIFNYNHVKDHYTLV